MEASAEVSVSSHLTIVSSEMFCYGINEEYNIIMSQDMVGFNIRVRNLTDIIESVDSISSDGPDMP